MNKKPSTLSDRWLTHFFAGFVGAMLVVISIALCDSSLAKDVIGVIESSFTVAAFGIGIIGINAWRKQLQGTALFDACRDCYKAAIVWHRKLQVARSPFAMVYPKEGETDQQASDRQRDEVIKKTHSAWLEFYNASVALEVFLPDGSKQAN